MSESTIPSTPKQIAEQINREAGIPAAVQSAGEATQDPVAATRDRLFSRLFHLRSQRGAELPYFKHLPLAYMTHNTRSDGPFKEHRWKGADGILLAEFYRIGERDWVVILWPRTETFMLAGKYMGKGETVQQAYEAAHRDQRLGKYSKTMLLRLANHAEQVGPLQRRNARLRSLATIYRTQRDALASALDVTHGITDNDAERDRELAAKHADALVRIEDLERELRLYQQAPTGDTVTLSRTEYHELIKTRARAMFKASQQESYADERKRAVRALGQEVARLRKLVPSETAVEVSHD